MKLPATRRTAALATAALTTAAIGVLTGVTPATADTTGPVITLQTPQPVAVGTAAATGTTTEVDISPLFTTDATSVNSQATLTIDARALAKIADVTFPDNCTVVKFVGTCSEWFYADDLPAGSLIGGETDLTVTARPGVAPGAAASYKVSGTADNATIVGGSGSVQIGGPAFSQAPLIDHTGLAVGSTVDEPLDFTNVGDRPAANAQLLLTASAGLTFAQHFANCKYSSLPDDKETEEALCTFAGPFQVGEHTTLASPVRLNVTSTAYYTYLDTYTAAQGDPYMKQQLAARTWKQGRGDTLALTVLDPGQPSTAPAGKIAPQFADGYTSSRITALRADNTADFAVTGATAQAAQGATAQLDFSLANNGPATIYYRSGDDFALTVTPPPGTTVTGSSANCEPEQQDDPVVTAHGPYLCRTGYFVPAGQVTAFSLTVRVDSVVPGAQGTAAIAWSPDGSYRPPFDPDAADDSAPLTLN
ncbi:hypothetical protein GA0115240_12958 [Streptomyces sp. DvalAA-14]|uniref:hypothetical protein n=1 Tax=unclassified Streptomyces TaxID=2593676 RepID=UPI00081B697C|nr:MULTISPECIES: hypothetical protein [unclassified Streptomyces]MYS21387.1 hypothetical protein [Streptomyces sp. SID4948]SCD91289.1 hypothetical protein GA0115240_12958 [Streptomyces sp. DvalAA-14]